MRAVVWHGSGDIRVEDVADPRIEESTDAIVRVTSTAICGADLYLRDVLEPFLEPGDVLGHEPIGVVEEVGRDVAHLKPGDRVVVPYNISCGHCHMCARGWHSQCETTQVREQGCGAAVFGFTKLYGQVPGAQAEYLRVPQAQFGPISVPDGPPDERFLYLSDVLPTAWQAVEYANVWPHSTVAVLGLGPVGQMAARIVQFRGARAIGVDPVAERVEMAERHGIETILLDADTDVGERIRALTDGRGADSVIDAIGIGVLDVDSGAAHAGPLWPAGRPDAQPRLGRSASLRESVDSVRRGGTISVVGLYGGLLDPLPVLTLFDKQVQVRMGQANVKRWIDDLMPLVLDDDDPLGVEDLATHYLPLSQAARGYDLFGSRSEGAIKVLLQPELG